MKWLGFGARREHENTLLVDIRPGVGDCVADVRCLPYPDGCFDGVEFHHVIEHLILMDARIALRELRRVLKPNGILEISCPDLIACLRTLETGNVEVLNNIYSPHSEVAQQHRWGYTKDSLKVLLSQEGFSRILEMSITEPHEQRFSAMVL